MEKCGVCGKTVYPTERVMAGDGGALHQACFRCHHCGGSLTLSNFASVNRVLYCKVHYIVLFKQSGGKYDVFGAYNSKGGSGNAHAPAPPVVAASASASPPKIAASSSSSSSPSVDSASSPSIAKTSPAAVIAKTVSINSNGEQPTSRLQALLQADSKKQEQQPSSRLQALLQADSKKVASPSAAATAESSSSSRFAAFLEAEKKKFGTPDGKTVPSLKSLTAIKDAENNLSLSPVTTGTRKRSDPQAPFSEGRRKSVPANIYPSEELSPAERLRQFIQATEDDQKEVSSSLADEGTKAASSSSPADFASNRHRRASDPSENIAREATRISLAAASTSSDENRKSMVRDRIDWISAMKSDSPGSEVYASKAADLSKKIFSESSPNSADTNLPKGIVAERQKVFSSQQTQDWKKGGEGVVRTKTIAERQQEYLANAQASKPAPSRVRSFNEGSARRAPQARRNSLEFVTGHTTEQVATALSTATATETPLSKSIVRDASELSTSSHASSENAKIILTEGEVSAAAANDGTGDETATGDNEGGRSLLKKTGSFRSASREKRRLSVTFSSTDIIILREEVEGASLQEQLSSSSLGSNSSGGSESTDSGSVVAVDINSNEQQTNTQEEDGHQEEE